ncbi:MAG: hypothetical protein QXX79_00905 [Candidatus Bathyarchaeia archaeon]
MISFKFIVITFCILSLLALSASLSILPAFCNGKEEAKLKIQAAENESLNCYRAVFEAEKAGANVSDLLKTLNEAGWFMSNAKLAYNNRDYGSAFTNAAWCLSKLEGFVGQAYSLKREAEEANRLNFMINFVGSAVSSIITVFGGYAVWILLKKSGKS